jgi:hypothetical protein
MSKVLSSREIGQNHRVAASFGKTFGSGDQEW